MEAITGQTIYENILSLDVDNNPVTGATFDLTTIKNGSVYTGVTINMTLTDASRGIYLATWSADTIGDYQIYVKNNTTNVIFVSNIVTVTSDSDFIQNIYVGL